MKVYQALSISMGAIGWVLLLILDWRIALGVFLVLWGNNLERDFRE